MSRAVSVLTGVSDACTDIPDCETGGVGRKKSVSKIVSVFASLACISCSDDSFFCWNSSALFLSRFSWLGGLRLYEHCLIAALSRCGSMAVPGVSTAVNLITKTAFWFSSVIFQDLSSFSLSRAPRADSKAVCRQSYNWHGARIVVVLRQNCREQNFPACIWPVT